jgi:hypothetical protein
MKDYEKPIPSKAEIVNEVSAVGSVKAVDKHGSIRVMEIISYAG